MRRRRSNRIYTSNRHNRSFRRQSASSSLFDLFYILGWGYYPRRFSPLGAGITVIFFLLYIGISGSSFFLMLGIFGVIFVVIYWLYQNSTQRPTYAKKMPSTQSIPPLYTPTNQKSVPENTTAYRVRPTLNTCPTCGDKILPGDAFCASCGTKL